MKNYAIVGFGCAGFHAARAIRQLDPSGRIAVFSDTWAARPSTPC